MPSYFKLRIGLSRAKCTEMVRYFCDDATGLCSVNEYADGAIYLSPVPPKHLREKYPNSLIRVPAEAVPCTAEEYAAAHARYDVAAAKKKAEEEAMKALRKGMSRNAHAAQEAGAAEPAAVVVAPMTPAPLAHFLDDFTILDFETANDKPIELAAVRYQNWQEVGRLQSFVALPAGEFVPARISDLTGITSSMLRGAPDCKKVLQQFKKLAGESLLIAHNVPYDRRILEKARTELGATTPLANAWLCTLTVARVLFPSEPSHKLPDLCRSFNITVVGSHRALNDVLMTYQLLHRMHQQSPIAEALVGQTSAAKAKKATAQPSLFAA